ncbi:MAG: sensor histidine kinase [Chloroflexota bacterium]
MPTKFATSQAQQMPRMKGKKMADQFTSLKVWVSRYNFCMIERPSDLLIRTYQFAIGLKFVGALVAIGLSYILIRQWVFDGWAMALITPIILLLLLVDWPNSDRNKRLAVALAFGILAPHIDLTYSVWYPRTELLANPRFIEIGWSLQDVNRIHAMGQFFIVVPVILASWQFKVRGFLGALALAGLAYTLMPLLLKADSLFWGIYAVRGFVLLGVTLIVGFITGTLAESQRSANEKLQEANQQLAAQAVMMEQLATSQERNRLARELHDTLAHSLSGTAVSLQAIGTLLKHDPEAAKSELASAQSQIRSGLSEARRAITALRASPLEELGLVGAIQQRADNISERAGIKINSTLTELSALSPEVEQTIYRICDESLVNIEKHAQAKKVDLTLSQSPAHIVLNIKDDGVGFSTHHSEKNGCFGLIGMQERADLIKADLQITSQPGSGTEVVLKVAK